MFMKKLSVLIFCLLFTSLSFPESNTNRKTVRPENTKPSLSYIVCRLQDEVSDIELKMGDLIYENKKLMPERAALMDDIDKVIRKIDNKEITCRNEEITDISNRIGILHYKSEDIIKRSQDLEHRYKTVQCRLYEDPRLKSLVSMDHLYETVGKLNDLVEEVNHQVLLYNDKVDKLDTKIKNLPYCPSEEETSSDENPSASVTDENSQTSSLSSESSEGYGGEPAK